ncbi:hypothetical protein M413DRAFT_445317 [Hebeloma cylindrosporum]|uniref:Endonuclease/exonuclease/phosphatase domain-containing protein n=1 Tax=Hebeloma cylindrosporum TaxID=76867 RepID=A0A0C3CAP0_HEBCY|nr:hypothetical protein M413DRAFT_445317 [Hebeloma cylindrosporum h7]
MVITNRLRRTLSAFNHSTRNWAPIPLRNAQTTERISRVTSDTSQTPQRLSLISWNIDAFSSRAISRAKLILNHVLEGQKYPDILFLQEVTTDVRTSLLNDERVRSAFLVTDAEDKTSFENVPFATMTLLSRARFSPSSSLDSSAETGLGDATVVEGRGSPDIMRVAGVSRLTLPSKYGRDALYVDIVINCPIAPPGNGTTTPTVLRLINVHLDSLRHTAHYRAQQLEILAHSLVEPGYHGGIIAGDFNAITPDDHALVDKNGLVDVWVALHGGRAGPAANGATWRVNAVDPGERRDGLGRGRLDKVVMKGLNLRAEEMEILRPGIIEVPCPGEKSEVIPWSDHCGLRCTFTV